MTEDSLRQRLVRCPIVEAYADEAAEGGVGQTSRLGYAENSVVDLLLGDGMRVAIILRM